MAIEIPDDQDLLVIGYLCRLLRLDWCHLSDNSQFHDL